MQMHSVAGHVAELPSYQESPAACTYLQVLGWLPLLLLIEPPSLPARAALTAGSCLAVREPT